MNRILLGVALVLIVSFGVYSIFFLDKSDSKKEEKKTQTNVNSFEECVAAGNKVATDFPRKCTAGDRTFSESIGNAQEKMNMIVTARPLPNTVVKSPLNVEGAARGKWFFEASFPVKIVDDNGKVLGTANATTTENWMTEDYVPFKATLTFEESTTSTGKLILEKDNPSGQAENADQLEIPVKFR